MTLALAMLAGAALVALLAWPWIVAALQIAREENHR